MGDITRWNEMHNTEISANLDLEEVLIVFTWPRELKFTKPMISGFAKGTQLFSNPINASGFNDAVRFNFTFHEFSF